MRTAALVLVLVAGCRGKQPADRVVREPLEERPPNAEGQTPAFPGQTRAPLDTADVGFDVETVATGLEFPWAVAFLPDGAFLVTERPGRLRIISPDGELSAPVIGVPDVDARDQGGLLDVVVDRSFEETRRIFFCYAEPREDGNGTALARARLVRDERPHLEGVEVIWRMTPTLESTKHFGCRVVFARDGSLFVTTGERSIAEGRRQAQRLDSGVGKVIRIRPDGSVPADNPLVARPGALPEIWSWGHRNIQAAALHPDSGVLWEVEHGARGGDEINIVEPGRDYGWPTIAYGIEYAGGPIGQGLTRKDGMEQPIYYWDPVIAPSGMAFYDADRFAAWKGSLFVGALADTALVRLTLEGNRVVGEERLLAERGDRIRDVRVGPDGAIYLLTDEPDGELLRLVPSS